MEEERKGDGKVFVRFHNSCCHEEDEGSQKNVSANYSLHEKKRFYECDFRHHFQMKQTHARALNRYLHYHSVNASRLILMTDSIQSFSTLSTFF